MQNQTVQVLDLFLQFFFLGGDLRGHGRALGLQLCGQRLIAEGEDLGRQPGGVFGTVESNGGHRDAAGHLHRGQQSVQAIHRAALHGDADDRQGGVGRKGTGQMGGHTGSAEDDAEAVGLCALGKRGGLGGRAVGGKDVGLKGDAQRLQLGAGPFYHRPIAVRTHDHCNFTNHLYSNLSFS